MNQFRIAYFVNQYPKVSHTFIRREIQALERQGFAIQRIALRGWDAELVDADDMQERERTRFVLQAGVIGLILSMLKIMVTRPIRFLMALQSALKMGIHADRPLFFHLIYLAEACRMIPWLKEFDAQHVHAHFGTNSTEVVMLAHALGGPSFSFTVHGPEEFDKPQFLAIREKVRHAAFVVAISSFGRSQLYRWIDYVDWPKVHVVHCGLDQTFFDVPAVPIPEAPRVVCVGRLNEQKGQLLLVNAVHRLAQEGVELEVVLAGDGDMRADLENLIKKCKLQDRIRITGWINSNQVRDEILSSRALLLPSFAEGLPVVIMEAMALRRPVLTTYIAGIPELIRPGKDGWLFPAGDVEALVSTLKDFLATPLGLLQTMGNAGHMRVLERHSIDIEAGKLAKLIRSAIIDLAR
jgi:glycosyltransferase involved in cell wall biosynthesis